MNKCPKCDGEMESGVIPDSLTTNVPSVWGTEVNKMQGAVNQKQVVTYRCKNCGYLESYAK